MHNVRLATVAVSATATAGDECVRTETAGKDREQSRTGLLCDHAWDTDTDLGQKSFTITNTQQARSHSLNRTNDRSALKIETDIKFL